MTELCVIIIDLHKEHPTFVINNIYSYDNQKNRSIGKLYMYIGLSLPLDHSHQIIWSHDIKTSKFLGIVDLLQLSGYQMFDD